MLLVHQVSSTPLEDAKFGRAETAGIDQLMAEIAIAHERDGEGHERASALLDDLLRSFAGERRGK